MSTRCRRFARRWASRQPRPTPPASCRLSCATPGCVVQQQPCIDYYIGEDQKDEIIDELKAIEEKLGDELKKFHDFFNKNNGWNDKMLEEAGLDRKLLQDYADYGFGQKLLKCVEENGECNFSAEL